MRDSRNQRTLRLLVRARGHPTLYRQAYDREHMPDLSEAVAFANWRRVAGAMGRKVRHSSVRKAVALIDECNGGCGTRSNFH